MLRIADRDLPEATVKVLRQLQAGIDGLADYPAQVEAAGRAWNGKTSSKAKRAAFTTIRATLAGMCVGPVRCAYCEDSLADEVEHIRPKALFPELVFVWANYLFACGPCNGPKSSRHGTMIGDRVEEFVRRRDDPILAPTPGPSALLDPRVEDPMRFLELDLGGVTRAGQVIDGTFEFLAADGLGPADSARADFSIRVLGLNREVMRVARGNAFGGFRARLREYVEDKEAGAGAAELARLQDDLLGTPHLTVFAEMRRQRGHLPGIDNLLRRAPEAATWPLVPA